MLRLGSTLVLLSTLICAQRILASELLPYEAAYKTRASGFNVVVKRRLDVQDSKIIVRTAARKFLFGLREKSELISDNDGNLKPLSHEHKRRGLSHRHDKELVFDWTSNTVHDLLKPRRPPLSVDSPTYDKLGYQVQMRLDLIRDPDRQRLEYAVTNGVRNRNYVFNRRGEEVLDTPVGDLRTVKFEREKDDDEREIYIWVAVDWGFLLVRIDQTDEPGAKIERMILESAEIAGNPVRGIAD